MISLLLALSEENVKNHIYYLANDYLEGRFCGYNQKARDYIKFYLNRMGYEVLTQHFDIDGKIKIDSFYINLKIPIKPLYFSSSGYVKSKDISIIDGDSIDEIEMIHKAIEERNKKKKIIIFLVSNYIQKSYFKNDLGIIALQTLKTYKDSLKNIEIEVYLKLSKEKINGENIFAIKKGKSLRYIVLGAHYDHLGYGDISSLDKIYDIHNGADDNASGVAGVIEIANYYKDKEVRDNILFAFWDCEEIGTVGSDYFIKNPIIPIENIKAYINFDMIGRLENNNLTIIGTKTANEFEDIIKRINEKFNFNIKFSNSGFGSSDQNAFYNAKIPVLHIFTNAHKDYHKTTDDPQFINYEGEKKILEFTIEIIDEISKIEALTYNEIKENRTIRNPNRVRLGIIPDYNYDGEGVRVLGTSNGTPAQKLGLKEGDIILKIGNYEIKNIYDLTYALTKFKKGQKSTILYKSEQKILKKQVVF
jgi:hypothetical protein